MNEPTHWIQTIGSGYVDLMHARPAHINFQNMGVALARVARWGAQTETRKFSVVQHLVEGARAIMRERGDKFLAGCYLLHDGHEHVIGDIPSPVALAIGEHAARAAGGDARGREIVKAGIESLKAELDRAIYLAAGYDWPLPAHIKTLVKEYDERMLTTEKAACMAASPFATWRHGRPVFPPLLGVDCVAWSETWAAWRFFDACQEMLPVFQR